MSMCALHLLACQWRTLYQEGNNFASRVCGSDIMMCLWQSKTNLAENPSVTWHRHLTLLTYIGLGEVEEKSPAAAGSSSLLQDAHRQQSQYTDWTSHLEEWIFVTGRPWAILGLKSILLRHLLILWREQNQNSRAFTVRFLLFLFFILFFLNIGVLSFWIFWVNYLLLTVHSANPSTRQLSYCVHKSASLVRSLSAQGISVCEQKPLHILALNVCAVLSKPRRLSPRASLCFQSCSVSPRHQPSCALLLNYVFGIARRARLEGDWGQTPQALGQLCPRQGMPVCTGKVLLWADAGGSQLCGVWGADVLSASVTQFWVYFGGNESRN